MLLMKATAEAGDETPAECWICRDASLAEPLLRPCRCRGSMEGVHASCVETWVRCHRRATRSEIPQCPVCKTPYGGVDRRPGPKALARQLSRAAARQLVYCAGEGIRLMLLGALLVQYSALAAPPKGNTTSPASAMLAMSALVAFLLHKLAVLTASLPPHRTPPTGPARCFFTADLWCIARHVAELSAAVMLLGTRCVRREMLVGYFAPVGLVALVPVGQLFFWYPVSVCLKEVAVCFSFLTCLPAVALLELGNLALRHRRRLMNPLDGSLHIVIALAAVVLCLLCRSRRPAAALFALHSCLLGIGLLERTAFRRLRWQDGQAWWCAVLIAVEAASVACGRGWFTLLLLLAALRSLQRMAAHPRPQALFQGTLWWCTFLIITEASNLGLREVRGTSWHTIRAEAPQVEAAACIWLGLVGGMACAVNWKRCVRHYHGWQRRHATFMLSTPGTSCPSSRPLPGTDTDTGSLDASDASFPDTYDGNMPADMV